MADRTRSRRWREMVASGISSEVAADRLSISPRHRALLERELARGQTAAPSNLQLRLGALRQIIADETQPAASRLKAMNELRAAERELAREQLAKQQRTEPARTNELGHDLRASFQQQFGAAARTQASSSAHSAPNSVPRLESAGAPREMSLGELKGQASRSDTVSEAFVVVPPACAAPDPDSISDEQILATLSKLPLPELRDIARSDFNAALVSTDSESAARELLSLHRGLTAPIPAGPPSEREQHLAKARANAERERNRPRRLHPEDLPIKGPAKWGGVV